MAPEVQTIPREAGEGPKLLGPAHERTGRGDKRMLPAILYGAIRATPERGDHPGVL